MKHARVAAAPHEALVDLVVEFGVVAAREDVLDPAVWDGNADVVVDGR